MDTLLVKTKLGAIQGHIVSCENGCAVEEYLGIPYAQPPVHKLRFKDPQPLIKLPKGETRCLINLQYFAIE